MPKIVIGITGMPGSGKTTAANYASQLSYPMINMGDVIREMAQQRGLAETRRSLEEMMLEVRREQGPAAVARHCISKIEGEESPLVIVDGIRSLEEVEKFKEYFPVFLITVDCSMDTRFKRLRKRKRIDDPTLWEEFTRRESLELGIGLNKVIATADYVVVNEGTKADLKENIQSIVRKIAKEHVK